jgi:hypothetical protein
MSELKRPEFRDEFPKLTYINIFMYEDILSHIAALQNWIELVESEAKKVSKTKEYYETELSRLEALVHTLRAQLEAGKGKV